MWTQGLLEPRHIAPSRVVRIGKESNRLAETPMAAELDEEAVVEYPLPQRCPMCGVEVVGRRKWCSEACRKRAARRAGRLGVPRRFKQWASLLPPAAIGLVPAKKVLLRTWYHRSKVSSDPVEASYLRLDLPSLTGSRTSYNVGERFG